MPTIGNINVKISADDSDLKRKLTTSKASLQKFSKASKAATKAIAVISASAATGAGALAFFARSQAEANRELSALSRLANTSESRFRSMAFASSQFGVEQEKLADVLKDTQDKIGDFVATGGGPLKDFFDNIGDKAGLTADRFRQLSGPDALQAYVSALEDANLPQSEMVFYMEAIASDSTKLLPLFKNQGAELKRLAGRYDEVSKGLQLTGSQQKGLEDLGSTFDLFTKSGGDSANLIAATLAPTLDDLFGGLIEVVPTATQAIVDFFNTFIDAENLSSIKAAENRLSGSMERLAELEGKLQGKRGRNRRAVVIGIEREKEEIEQLKARIEELKQAEQKLADARRLSVGTISIGSTVPTTPTTPTTPKAPKAPKESNDEFGFDPHENPFLMDQDLIREKQEQLLEQAREFWTRHGEITRHGLTAMTGMVEQNYGRQAGAIANSFASILGDTATYSKKAFEINKKVSLGQAVVKGYEAATSAWAAGMSIPGPQAPVVAAAYMAASIAKTAAQIQAIRSQKFGGGGSTSAGGGTGGASGTLPGASVPQESNTRPNTVTTINLQGDTFSRDSVGALISSINDALEDGYTLRLAG